MNKPILQTERLILRSWQQSDISLMAKINSDPKVMKYYPSTQTLEQTKKFVKHCQISYDKYGFTFFPVELKTTSEFIGFVGLNVPEFEIPNFTSRSDPVVEIGWRLKSDQWNKGYATEAALEILRFAFTQLNLNEIISFTTVHNNASRRVMEKIGLRRDNFSDFDHPKLGSTSHLRPHILYRKTRKEFLNGMGANQTDYC